MCWCQNSIEVDGSSAGPDILNSLFLFLFPSDQSVFKYFCGGESTSLLSSLLTLMGVWISRHLRVSWFQKMGRICVGSDNSAQEPWRNIILLITVLPRDPVHGDIRTFREAEVLFYFYFWYIDAFWVAFAYYSFESISFGFLLIKKPCGCFAVASRSPKCVLYASEQVFLFQPAVSNGKYPFASHFWEC